MQEACGSAEVGAAPEVQALERVQELVLAVQQQATTLNALLGNPDLPIEQYPPYRQAQAVLDAADARLARFVLRAEATGAILDTHAEPGEVLQPGTPVVTLGETRRPYIDVFVPQTDLAGMGPGTPAEVRVDAYPGQVFRGAVEVVGRTLEFTPRYLFSDKERPNLVVRVRVDVEDSQERLHAGVPAFAWIAPQLEARK